MKELLLKDYKPTPALVRPEHIPLRAKYPVVDSHNHLWEESGPEAMLRVMDEVGVQVFNNVTGNTRFSLTDTGYRCEYRDIDYFLQTYVAGHPDRFSCFTMSEFANVGDLTLIRDRGFAARAIRRMEEDVRRGARGLKITKELGLRFEDAGGSIVAVDDERLAPIWDRAGELGIPVLIHTSDPVAQFKPLDEYNERYLTLQKAPEWHFYGSYYSKEQLLAQRDRMIARHPQTTFICAHVANYPENLAYVSQLLDTHPNANIDITDRLEEIGRQPYSAREFMIAYQDRILFGTDSPLRPEAYSSYYRFLETRDECFKCTDYTGTSDNSRWGIYGLYLPDKVLKKIYYGNACRLIPGMNV